METFHHITPEVVKEFSLGLHRLFCYLDSRNMYSFNLTIYIGYRPAAGFWCHARILPRTLLPPMGISDISFLELLHDQPGTFRSPEEACAEAKAYFR